MQEQASLNFWIETVFSIDIEAQYQYAYIPTWWNDSCIKSWMLFSTDWSLTDTAVSNDSLANGSTPHNTSHSHTPVQVDEDEPTGFFTSILAAIGSIQSTYMYIFMWHFLFLCINKWILHSGFCHCYERDLFLVTVCLVDNKSLL